MLKKAGLFAILFSALGAVAVPTAAMAQECRDQPYAYSSSYRNYGYDERAWREEQRRQERIRAEERHAAAIRAEQWRERQRWEARYHRPYVPSNSFYFGFNR